MTFTDNGKVVLERMFSVTPKSSWMSWCTCPRPSGKAHGDGVPQRHVHGAQGKATLVVAHTAAVPPADIRVDNKVLFANIANGESLKLTVPVATYKVAIVPTGETKPVLLGPLSSHRPGRCAEPGLCRGRPGEEDHERRRARDREPAPPARPSRRGQHRNRRPGGRSGPSLVVNLAR